MNKLLLLLTLAPCLAFGQTTLIPDANFEQRLIDLAYDTGTPDGSVPTANIDTVTYLSVWNKNISDLTGIEDFTALTEFNCGNNGLTSLDVSNNTALTWLHCYSNQLTSLDVSNNTALTYLGCYNNQLTSLDVSNNTALTVLRCWDNQLTSLDVSNNTALTDLRCYNNQLTSLDVSNNTALGILRCFDNQLTCLNVKNGNNQNMTDFAASFNPNLTCIEVDDATWSTSNWTSIDSQTSFSEDCNYPTPCGSGTTGIEELPTIDIELLYITDILGRTTLPTPNTLLFYIYEDGSVEKKMLLDD